MKKSVKSPNRLWTPLPTVVVSAMRGGTTFKGRQVLDRGLGDSDSSPGSLSIRQVIASSIAPMDCKVGCPSPDTWMLRSRRRILAIALVALTGLLCTANASAAIVFTVNSTQDGVDDNPGNGVCHTSDGTCTLRAAVMEANRASNTGATIVLPASIDPYILQIFPAGTDGEENGDLNLTTPLSGNPVITITGSGATGTVIDANGIDRVLDVSAGRTAAISGLTIRNGAVTGATGSKASEGGAIFNRGSLALTDSVVSNSSASYEGGGIFNDDGAALVVSRSAVNANSAGADGGGIYAYGSTTVSYSSIHANHAASFGGGILIYSGGQTLNVDHSTINENAAASDGGGVYVDGAANIRQSALYGNSADQGGGIYNIGTLFVVDSTVSQNQSHGDGGGIFTFGNALWPTNVYNSTIAFNQADDASVAAGTGGGVHVESGGVFNMRNTVVAGNYLGATQIPSDCNGTIGIYGHNRIESGSGCSFTLVNQGSVFLLDSISELGPLQDNGGPTLTHALLPPSSMIDGGVICNDQNGAHLGTDQRGRPRPPAPGGQFVSTCDIGAFEYNEIFPSGFELP